MPPAEPPECSPRTSELSRTSRCGGKHSRETRSRSSPSVTRLGPSASARTHQQGGSAARFRQLPWAVALGMVRLSATLQAWRLDEYRHRPCHYDGFRAPGARRTRRRPVAVRLTPPAVESGRKRRPEMPPLGCASHRRTSGPRAGNAARNTDPASPMRRRLVDPSRITSSRDALVASHPRAAAAIGPRRAFRSSAKIVACTSGTADFTSITRIVRDAACQASTSIEPRSPKWLKDTSIAHSHPAAASRATNASTVRAWASSSSRSRPSPRHLTRMSRSAPSARHRDSTRRMSLPSAPPHSTFETKARDTRARAAASCCRSPVRSRMARNARPIRTASTTELSGEALTSRL
jgi:hypothetical protein